MKRAFTLIELLVVIAIVGLLAGLLLPAIAAARRQAWKADALSRLRQLGVAATLYADDHDGALPMEKPAGGSDNPSWDEVGDPANSEIWYNALPRLMGVPTAATFATGDRAGFYSKRNLFYMPGARYPANRLAAPMFGVAVNSKLQEGDAPLNIAAVREQSRTALFIESGLADEALFRASPKQSSANLTGQPHAYASRFVVRYANRGGIAFVDGHAEMLKGDEVVDPASGKAYNPQSKGQVYWTPNPAINANN